MFTNQRFPESFPETLPPRGRYANEYRPKVVEQRTHLGDLEGDFMVGKAHKSALLVITYRATLLTRLKKVTSRGADHTKQL